MSVVGFDIGNDTCYVAVSKGGGIEVIDNEYSLRATPSYVGFNERCRDLGVTAKAKLIPNIENTVFGFKSVLGSKYNESLSEQSYLSVDFREFPSGDIGVQVQYARKQVVFSLQQVMAMLLTKLKAIAEANLGISVRDCVISVPMYYTDAQRHALLCAADIAGLKALKLLNEPTAIALAYGFYKQNLFEQLKTVVFVDLGQSALTVTACSFENDTMKVLGSVWNRRVGGRDFDCVLVKHFADHFKTAYDLEVMLNKKALMALILECENLKKQMSMNSRELDLHLECFMDDVDVRGKIRRSLFEELSADLLKGIEETMRDLLVKTGLGTDQVYAVQLVGGSSRIPAVKDLVSRVFGKAPNSTLNQDESVARGCALQCAFLSPTLRTRPYHVHDIQPYALQMAQRTEQQEEVLEAFPLFHPTPAARTLSLDFQGPFILEVRYADPDFLYPQVAAFAFSKFPDDVREGKIELEIAIDKNGLFAMNPARLRLEREVSVSSESLSLALVPISDDGVEEEETPGPTQTAAVAAQPKLVTEYYDAEFETLMQKMPQNVLEDLAEAERGMIAADLREKRRADLRNNLEEYVYSMKDRLREDLVAVVTEEGKARLLQLLEETEAWLDDNEELGEADLARRDEDLRLMFRPVLERACEHRSIAQSLKDFRQLLESSWEEITTLAESCGYSDTIRQLEESWRRSKAVLETSQEQMEGFLPDGDFPVSSSALRGDMRGFEEAFQRLAVASQAKGDVRADKAARDPATSPEQTNHV